MTYLFKLASRISRLRLVFPLFLVSAFACSKGEKVEFLGPNPGSDVPKLSLIRIDPKVASAQVGSPVKFTVSAYSATGTPMLVAVDWIAQGGSISATGEYIGQTTGQFTVLARARENPSLADSASVNVWNSPVDQVAVIVSPDSALIEEGDSLSFTAAVALANGIVTGDAPVNWSADGGLISSSGKFTVPQSGVYTVSATTSGGLRGYAKVFVRRRVRTLLQLTVSPKSSTVQPGSTSTFSTIGQYSDGTSGAANDIQWSATGGSVAANGSFTAGSRAGSYRVIAANSQNTVADTAAVTISGASAVGISISPKSVSLQPSASTTFSGMARMSDGSVKAVPVTWQATGGSIASDGTYLAGSAAGAYKAIATSAGVPGADTATITIAQSGAPLISILLNPASVTLATRQTRQFNITGVWGDGSNSAPPVTWTSTGGSITTGGLFTAGTAPGTYRVIAAAAGGVADTSQVTVLPAVLTSLIVSPPSGGVVAGQSLQFSAVGTWSDSSTTAASVTWSATGGTISAGGLYTSGTSAGAYRVIATQVGGTLADTSLVTVSLPTPILNSIALSPSSVVVGQGGTHQFTALGMWSDGSTGSPAITWTATGGTVSSTGRYTAGSLAGPFRIIARLTSGTMADTSSIVITAPAAVTTLTIAPKTTAKQVGTSTQFIVGATWSNGSTTVPPLTWTATGGTVNSSGLFTAGSSTGTFKVIAAHQGGTLADTATVTLTVTPPPPPPTLSSLTIAPKPASVTPGQTRQFTVTGTWSDGSFATPSVTWSATGGSITPSGLYSAGPTTGSYRVIAWHVGGTRADTATVTILSGVPVLTNLSVSPKPVTAATGATVQFNATAVWSDGSTTPPAITWSSNGGAMHGTGMFVAGTTPGTFQVVANGGGKADTASVTLTSGATPVVTSFVMTPATATIAAGTTKQFQTSATWSDGASRAVSVSYSATGGTVSVGGVFTAGSVAGVFAVIATCNCGLADTSAVQVTVAGPQTLLSLQLNPATVTLPTGGTQQFVPDFVWSNGSLVPPIVTYSATAGSVSATGLYTAPTSAGAYQVYVSYLGGILKDTSVVTVVVPIPPSSLYPNRPSNFTVVESDYSFNVPIPANLADGPMGDGSGWGVVGSGTTMYRSTDPGNPFAPSGVLEWKYARGQGTPTNSAAFGHLYRGVPPGQREWYIAFPLWHDSNFEFNRISNKLIFLQGSVGAIILQTKKDGPFWNVVDENNTLTTSWDPNVNAGTNPTGRWVNVEWLVKRGPGGYMKLWVDGALVQNYTNTNLSDIGTWQDININSTWGGGSGPTTRDSFRRMGHIFIAHP